MADFRTISAALSDQPALEAAVSQAIAQNPQIAPLFTSLAEYIINIKGGTGATTDSQPSKKRRLEANGDSRDGTFHEEWRAESSTALLILPELSFLIPQRKKFTFEVTDTGLRARGSTGVLEFGSHWKDIGNVIFTPQPEKAVLSFLLTVLPTDVGAASGSSIDGIVLSLPNSSPKLSSPNSVVRGDDTYVSLLTRIISQFKEVTTASDSTFKSAAPQAGRKDAALHVKAFRGSKEGSLFFLETGILWGFKKPILFIPLTQIHGIAYTSILQRTFNLVVNFTLSSKPVVEDPEIEEVEFSMIDQVDFPGISDFVSERGVQDGSLAASRRAKELNINPKGEGGENLGASELERAQKEIEAAEEDAEDEEEEDYDPGSEGESEGEGSSSSDEDYPDAAADAAQSDAVDADGNLVEDELGSQAESISTNGEDESEAVGIAARRNLPSR